MRWFARTYLSFVRGTPLLIQIFLIYYALPGLIGIDVPAFTAGVIALSLNSGAFTSEILRGGLSAIAPGQLEAAQALGLSRFDVWSRVILPQLARLVLPPMVNELAMLVQASALLSVIAVVDLTRAAQNVMNTTYRPVEALTVAAVIYFVALFVLGHSARALERRTPVKRS
jgi:polar amino acid transport system permease protein